MTPERTKSTERTFERRRTMQVYSPSTKHAATVELASDGYRIYGRVIQMLPTRGARQSYEWQHIMQYKHSAADQVLIDAALLAIFGPQEEPPPPRQRCGKPLEFGYGVGLPCDRWADHEGDCSPYRDEAGEA